MSPWLQFKFYIYRDSHILFVINTADNHYYKIKHKIQSKIETKNTKYASLGKLIVCFLKKLKVSLSLSLPRVSRRDNGKVSILFLGDEFTCLELSIEDFEFSLVRTLIYLVTKSGSSSQFI